MQELASRLGSARYTGNFWHYQDPQSWTNLNVSLIVLVDVVLNGSVCVGQVL